MEKMNPMSTMPGYEAMKAQQEMFLKAMTGGMSGAWGTSSPSPQDGSDGGDDLNDIKRELAELQEKLARMSK